MLVIFCFFSFLKYILLLPHLSNIHKKLKKQTKRVEKPKVTKFKNKEFKK